MEVRPASEEYIDQCIESLGDNRRPYRLFRRMPLESCLEGVSVRRQGAKPDREREREPASFIEGPLRDVMEGMILLRTGFFCWWGLEAKNK